MTITDINPPTAEPIDLSYAKMFLRVDFEADDALIADLICSARERVEALIRGTLITRRRVYYSEHALAPVFISHSPVTLIHSIKVTNLAGDIVVIPPSDVVINYRSDPVAVCLRDGHAWRDYVDNPGILAIELDAGYGPSAADIPMPLKQAMLLLIAQSYEYRDETNIPGIPMMVDALLMPYRGLRL